MNDKTSEIEGTYVFGPKQSRQGYRLNKLCMSLTDPVNRERFLADEDGYVAGYDLAPEHVAAIRDRDWLKMVQTGGNIYMLIKMGHLLGQGLYAAGAQQRGETLEEFLATRNAQGAR